MLSVAMLSDFWQKGDFGIATENRMCYYYNDYMVVIMIGGGQIQA
jgi:hypothetical protein